MARPKIDSVTPKSGSQLVGQLRRFLPSERVDAYSASQELLAFLPPLPPSVASAAVGGCPVALQRVVGWLESGCRLPLASSSEPPRVDAGAPPRRRVVRTALPPPEPPAAPTSLAAAVAAAMSKIPSPAPRKLSPGNDSWEDERDDV